MNRIFKCILYLVPVFVFGISAAAVSCNTAHAATDSTIYENARFRVVAHTYTGNSTSYEEMIATTSGSYPKKYTYNIEWPITFDIHIKNDSTFTDTISGYLIFPITVSYGLNQSFVNAVYNGTLQMTYLLLDDNIIPNFSNNDNIQFNFFQIAGQKYVSLMIDSLPVSTLDFVDNYFCLSANFTFVGGMMAQAPMNYLVDKGGVVDYYQLYTPLHKVVCDIGNTTTWKSSLSATSNTLSSQVASAIDSSTDIDTILIYLNSINTSAALLSGVTSNISHLDGVLTNLYNYLLQNNNQYVTLLNSVVSEAQSQGTTLTNLYALLDSGGSISQNLADQLSQLRQIYSYTYNTNNMINRFITALVSPATPFYDPSVLRTNLRSFLIDSIREALEDWDVIIQVDQNTNIDLTINNNEVTNIYNNIDYYQDFETTINLNFETYIQQIDFDILDSSNVNFMPNLPGAMVAGKGWIERVWQALGPFQYLIVITLTLGLLAGLMGPVNRFIVSRSKK